MDLPHPWCQRDKARGQDKWGRNPRSPRVRQPAPDSLEFRTTPGNVGRGEEYEQDSGKWSTTAGFRNQFMLFSVNPLHDAIHPNQEGRFAVPQGPGLGIDPDPEVIERLRVL